jgi:rfaE bifunctional protein nucleotidyltransferase chain/domain
MSRRLVILGDVLLDVDVLTRADRLSPDGPVPVLDELTRDVRPGGAALAARLAASSALGTGDQIDVTLVAPIAEDDAGARLRAGLPPTVDVIPLPASGSTPVKMRLRAGGQTVARLDSGGGIEALAVPDRARRALAAANAILVSDYGGSAARHPVLRQVLAGSGAPIVWDPHPRGAPPVPGCALATPNLGEALAASGLAASTSDRPAVSAARQAGDLLRQRWGARDVCVTLGEHGALLAFGTGSSQYFPVVPASGGDACGAGDCFASAVTLALAGGALPSQAVATAVDSAAAFISGGGVTSLSTGVSVGSAIEDPVARVRAAGGVVVATGGCFDLLHPGHIHALAAARSLGDCLVVLLNSDDSVRRLKGPSRPVQAQADRARVLTALRSVDAVIAFTEDTPQRALARLRPDIWVKGGDYSGEELPEAELVRSWGGDVITVSYLAGRSTSTLVELARR